MAHCLWKSWTHWKSGVDCWREKWPKIAVLEKLTWALQKSVTDPEVRNRLESMGVSAVSAEQATPAALRQHLKNEIETLGGLLIKAGIKAN